MQTITRETKVCESCRASYYSWKKKNPDFSEMLSWFEKESLVDTEGDAYESSVNKNDFLKLSFSSLLYHLIE